MRGVRGRLGLRRGGRCGRGCGRRGKERGVEVLHDSLCKGEFWYHGLGYPDCVFVYTCDLYWLFGDAAYLSMLNPQLSSCTSYFIETTE